MPKYVAIVEQNAVTIQSEILFTKDPQPWAPVLSASTNFPKRNSIYQMADRLRLHISHEGQDIAFVKADGGWVLALRYEFSSMPGKGVPQGLDIGIARAITYLEEKLGLVVQDERKKKYKVRLEDSKDGEGGMMDMAPAQWVLEEP